MQLVNLTLMLAVCWHTISAQSKSTIEFLIIFSFRALLIQRKLNSNMIVSIYLLLNLLL